MSKSFCNLRLIKVPRWDDFDWSDNETISSIESDDDDFVSIDENFDWGEESEYDDDFVSIDENFDWGEESECDEDSEEESDEDEDTI